MYTRIYYTTTVEIAYDNKYTRVETGTVDTLVVIAKLDLARHRFRNAVATDITTGEIIFEVTMGE